MPVDGPSAGAAISIAVYSAITNSIIKNDVAITGEISLLGNINPIGGVNAKILAAKKAGATTVIIPAANWNEAFLEYEGVRIIPIKHIKEAIDISSVEILNSKRDILSAKSK